MRAQIPTVSLRPEIGHPVSTIYCTVNGQRPFALGEFREGTGWQLWDDAWGNLVTTYGVQITKDTFLKEYNRQ
eukprot:8502525-Pyramimonas_sp.AAC.1